MSATCRVNAQRSNHSRSEPALWVFLGLFAQPDAPGPAQRKTQRRHLAGRRDIAQAVSPDGAQTRSKAQDQTFSRLNYIRISDIILSGA